MNKITVVALLWAPVLAWCADPAASQSTSADSQLWSAAFYRLQRADALDFSLEYQVRLNEDLRALKSHFLELQTFASPHRAVELFGTYRLTLRPDHTEHRLMFGLFWRSEFGEGHSSVEGEPSFRIIHQIACERDFNVKFTDDLIDSNSLRWVTTASKPVNGRLTPFVLAGVLPTWNEEYDFDIDKLRLGAGVRIKSGETDRFTLMYLFEENRSRTPVTQSNIFYVRYEMFR